MTDTHRIPNDLHRLMILERIAVVVSVVRLILYVDFAVERSIDKAVECSTRSWWQCVEDGWLWLRDIQCRLSRPDHEY